MPDPVIVYQPFGTSPSWPPSPAKLDRDLDCQNHNIINANWSLDHINLTTDVTGKLPYANIADVPAQKLLGSTNGGVMTPISIGSNLTLTGDVLSAATSGGAGSGDFSTNTSTSVVNEIVLFSNTGGKQGKRSTGTGVALLTSGVLSAGAVDLSTSNATGLLKSSSFPVLTGAITTPGGSLVTTLSNGVVTNANLAGGIAASNLVGSDIATVGTITTGNWNGTVIPVAYGGTGASSAAAARANLGIQTTTTNGDSNYSITATDSTVVLNAALTGVRTWTLPQASTVNNGTVIKVADSVGGVSATNYIQITPFAGDTISGSTNSFILNRGYDTISLLKTGATAWTIQVARQQIRRVFYTNQTYTTRVGVKALFVEAIGAGGVGGGAAASSSNISIGAGGGGGAYCNKFISSPASSYLITIGTGGIGVSGASGGNRSQTTLELY